MSSLPQKTVLFIDDSLLVIESLGDAFDNMPNVHVRLCRNLKQAQDAYTEVRPDILFLDHRLRGEEGREGLDMAHWLKREGTTVTVFSTSGFLDAETLSKYTAIGVQYVGKDFARIKKAMEEALAT